MALSLSTPSPLTGFTIRHRIATRGEGKPAASRIPTAGLVDLESSLSPYSCQYAQQEEYSELPAKLLFSPSALKAVGRKCIRPKSNSAGPLTAAGVNSLN